jgi:hypothetical protein
MRWEGRIANVGQKTNAYRNLNGKPEAKTPLGRSGWVDNIKIDLHEGVSAGWVHLDQNSYLWQAAFYPSSYES